VPLVQFNITLDESNLPQKQFVINLTNPEYPEHVNITFILKLNLCNQFIAIEVNKAQRMLQLQIGSLLNNS